MMRAIVILAVFLSGLGIGGVGGWRLAYLGAAQAVEEGLLAGQRPPQFSVTDLNGTQRSLEDYAGNILVLHFWATWCPYCRSQIPQLQTLHNEWGRKGVEVLAISTDENPQQLQQFVEANRLPYPIIADNGEGGPYFLGDRYEVSSIPVTYILDREGKVFLRLQGAIDLIRAVEAALSEPAV